MKLKGILITIVILLSLVFAVLNWGVLIASVPINLLLTSIQFPVGLTLLILAVLLSTVFFVVSLIDRAGQLRQITQLERQLEALHKKLEQKRLTELESLGERFEVELQALVSQLSESANRLETVTKESLAEFEMRSKERLQHLEERVLLVRNELAADVAASQDFLKQELKPKS